MQSNAHAMSISRKPRTSSCTTLRMCGTSVKMRSGRKQRRIISRCGMLIAATFAGRQNRSVTLTCCASCILFTRSSQVIGMCLLQSPADGTSGSGVANPSALRKISWIWRG